MRLRFLNMSIYRHIPGRTNCRGFTLFELVLVIMLMSGITLAVVYSAQHAIDKMNYERSQVMVQNLKKAIDLYAQEVGRYPCPARPDLAITNPNYGREDCAWIATNRSVASNRAISTYPKMPVQITDITQNRVLIGHLPRYVLDSSGNFISMGQYIPAIKKEGSNLLLDPTGNPPIYAVAKKLTDRSVAAGADQRVSLGDYGNINIVNENGFQLSGVNNDARYVIVAQTYRNGGCVVGRRQDYENCDIVPDASADNRANDTFVIAPRALSTASNDYYYDDVVLFNNNIADQKWLSNEKSTITNNIKSSVTENRGLIYLNKDGNNVGISTNTPTEKLDVEGTLRAETNIRAPLICDKPAPITLPGSIGTVYLYPERYFNPDDIIVTKKNAAGTVTTLVRGVGADQYTVAAFDVAAGNGTITLNTAPLATDTITIVKKELCLDPLTVVRKFTPVLFTTSERSGGSSSLECPKINFSTSSLRNDPNWHKVSECLSPFTSCTNSLDRSLINITGTTRTIGGKLYREINFKNTNIHNANSPYYMGTADDPNFEDFSFYLDIDPAIPVQLNGAVAPTDLLPNNKKLLKVYKTLCTHKNDSAPGTCTDKLCVWNGPSSWSTLNLPADGANKIFSTGTNTFRRSNDLIVWLTPPGLSPVLQIMGTHYSVTGGLDTGLGAVGTIVMNTAPSIGSVIRIERKRCSGDTTKLLVEEPSGGLIPQDNIRFSVFGEKYLAGTTIDPSGVMRPICKNLEVNPVAVRNADGTNICPADQKLRGIQTDGRAICALD